MDNRRLQTVAKTLADPRLFEIFQKVAKASAEGLCCGADGEEFPVSNDLVFFAE